MNKLPKNWFVRHDSSKDFYNHVVPYINSIAKCNGEKVTGACRDSYYGFYHDRCAVSTPMKADATYLSIDEFIKLTKEEWVPQRGEMVEVSDDNMHWKRLMFLANIDGAKNPIVVVYEKEEELFLGGKTFDKISYAYIRRIEEPKTLEIKSSEAFEIIAKAKGVDKSLIKIVE